MATTPCRSTPSPEKDRWPSRSWPGEFPLVFNSGARSNVDLHALHQSMPSPLAGEARAHGMMNTGDAASRGIQHGDPVRSDHLRGSRFACTPTSPRTSCPGPSRPAAWEAGPSGPRPGEANVNDLTDLKRYDPISGFPVYKALLCEVTRVCGGRSRDRRRPGGIHPRWIPRTAVALPRRIYLDHNATTPLDPDVQRNPDRLCWTATGTRPASTRPARSPAPPWRAARRAMALLLNCTARRIIFTGGGSEANNLAIKGAASG